MDNNKIPPSSSFNNFTRQKSHMCVWYIIAIDPVVSDTKSKNFHVHNNGESTTGDGEEKEWRLGLAVSIASRIVSSHRPFTRVVIGVMSSKSAREFTAKGFGRHHHRADHNNSYPLVPLFELLHRYSKWCHQCSASIDVTEKCDVCFSHKETSDQKKQRNIRCSPH